MKIYRMAYGDDEPILRIAKEAWSFVVREYDDEDLKAVCLPVSRFLRDKLIKAGHNAIVVQGTFHVDDPDPNAYEDWDVGDFDDHDDMEQAKYDVLHYWVEVNGKMLDITSSQFKDEVDDELERIAFGPYEWYWRYTPVHKGWQ